jgi:hypothetical protein
VSDADVALIRSLQPPPGTDIAALFNDPAMWTAFVENAPAVFVDGFECAGIGAPQGDLEDTGFDGLRRLWNEWLSPWVSYYDTIEDVIGNGEKVMVLIHDRAVSRHSGAEVDLRGASVWTMRDGLIARVEFHTDRATARASFESSS